MQIFGLVSGGGRLRNGVEIVGDGEGNEGENTILKHGRNKLAVVQNMAKGGQSSKEASVSSSPSKK